LPALVLLRKPLYGLANRRLQPGTLGESCVKNYIKLKNNQKVNKKEIKGNKEKDLRK
jgi:hypothetical protein